MSATEERRILLETLDRINQSLKSNSNALTSTRAGGVDPERAYIELTRQILFQLPDPP